MAINYTTQQSYNPWANQGLSMNLNSVGVGNVAPEGAEALSQSGQQFTGQVLGSLGKGIDYIGNKLGNILPEMNISENLERLGGMFNPAPVQAAGNDVINEMVSRGGYDRASAEAVYRAEPERFTREFSGQPTQQPTQQPTLYTNPYTGKTSATPAGQPAPTKEQMLLGSYPSADIGDFDLNADDFMSEIESQYGSRIDYLKTAEEAIRLGQPEILEGIAADLRAGKSQEGTGKQKQLGILSGSEKEAQGRKEDVLASSRRLYDELRRGGIQRFGGASSAGGAMSELLGVEQQRQAGQIGREFSRAMDQISTQKADVESQYQSQLLQLDADNKNVINQANQEFRSRLDEINSNRLLASDAKSQARLGVLQELRDKMFSIQQQKTQFQQQLDMMKQEQVTSLDTYAKQLQISGAAGQQAGTQFGAATTTSPTSNITATGRQSTTPVGLTSAVGQINKDDERYQGPQSYSNLPLWMQR